MSDGGEGPPLELRGLFEQFFFPRGALASDVRSNLIHVATGWPPVAQLYPVRLESGRKFTASLSVAKCH